MKKPGLLTLGVLIGLSLPASAQTSGVLRWDEFTYPAVVTQVTPTGAYVQSPDGSTAYVKQQQPVLFNEQPVDVMQTQPGQSVTIKIPAGQGIIHGYYGDVASIDSNTGPVQVPVTYLPQPVLDQTFLAPVPVSSVGGPMADGGFAPAPEGPDTNGYEQSQDAPPSQPGYDGPPPQPGEDGPAGDPGYDSDAPPPAPYDSFVPLYQPVAVQPVLPLYASGLGIGVTLGGVAFSWSQGFGSWLPGGYPTYTDGYAPCGYPSYASCGVYSDYVPAYAGYGGGGNFYVANNYRNAPGRMGGIYAAGVNPSYGGERLSNLQNHSNQLYGQAANVYRGPNSQRAYQGGVTHSNFSAPGGHAGMSRYVAPAAAAAAVSGAAAAAYHHNRNQTSAVVRGHFASANVGHTHAFSAASRSHVAPGVGGLRRSSPGAYRSNTRAFSNPARGSVRRTPGQSFNRGNFHTPARTNTARSFNRTATFRTATRSNSTFNRPSANRATRTASRPTFNRSTFNRPVPTNRGQMRTFNRPTFNRPTQTFNRSTFNRPAQTFNRPTFNRPAQTFNRPTFNRPTFNRPAQTFNRPMQNFQRPQQTFNRPMQNFQRPQQTFNRPMQNFQRPAQTFNRPAPRQQHHR